MREVLISTLSMCLLCSAVPLNGLINEVMLDISDSAVRFQGPAMSRTETGPTPMELDRLRVEGFDAVYNLDYKTARERFEKMTQLAPDNPAGYVYLANNIWLETLKKSRRLVTTVYTSQSFYEVKTEDRVDAKRDQAFNQLIRQAIAASQTRIAKNQSDAEAVYYQ